jgi:RNA polymerase subunit RPABC4/transcription elongation factor Spt4
LDFDPIFEAIGDFFDNPIIQFAIQAAAVYVVVLWLASAYWAFRDLQHRTGNPVAPYLAAAAIILCTPLFFLLGVIIYKLVRPAERVGEVSERHLAEEALLAEVEAIRHCSTCHRRVHDDWIICPTCRTRLNRVCPNCGKLVGLDWSLCAWCGKDFERREVAAAESLPPVAEPRPVAARTPARSDDAPAPPTRRQATPRSSTGRSASALGSPDVLPER